MTNSIILSNDGEMPSTDSDALSILLDVSTEILFVLCLASGFMAFRVWERNRALQRKEHGSTTSDRIASYVSELCQASTLTIAFEKLCGYMNYVIGGKTPSEMILAVDDHEKVLCLWRAHKDEIEFSEVCEVVVRAYLAVEPRRLVKEVVPQLLRKELLLPCSAKLLDLVVEQRNLEVLDALLVAYKPHLFLSNSMAETVISAYAMAGEEARVDAWLDRRRRSDKVPVRALILAVRGLLLAQRPDAALGHAKEIIAQGQVVHQKVVTEIYKSYIKADRAAEGIFNALPEFAPTPYAGAALMEHCLDKSDLELAKIVEAMLKDKRIEIHHKAYESYFELLLGKGDPHAQQIWKEMQANDIYVDFSDNPPLHQEFTKLLETNAG